MDAALYLSLDQGGHSSRALVFDSRGRELARGRVVVSTRRPRPGWVEHDADELVESLREAAGEALRATGAAADRIRCAGLATQRSSIVCWDRNSGGALTPVLSWQDRRAQDMVDQLATQADTIHQRTGLFLTAYYGASKLRWCLDHFDTVAAAQRDGRLACGPLASYLLHRLLDESPLLADPANAARTLLWNPDRGDWDPWLLKLFGIPAQLLPSCVDSRYEYGHLRIGDRRIPVSLCMGDQPAALFAYGEPGTGQAYVNIGTGAFVQRILERDPGRPHNLLSGIAARDGARTTWVIEGTVNGAASALSAVEVELGLEEEAVKRILPQWLARRCSPPLFLNGVSGLGSPFWAPDFTSRFVGDGDDAEKLVAVVESIVFMIQVNLESMAGLAGTPRRIIATGGLATLDGLCQRIADTSGIEVYRPREREATARGTAFLLADRPQRWPETEAGTTFAPQDNPALQQRYRDWSRAMQEALAS